MVNVGKLLSVRLAPVSVTGFALLLSVMVILSSVVSDQTMASLNVRTRIAVSRLSVVLVRVGAVLSSVISIAVPATSPPKAFPVRSVIAEGETVICSGVSSSNVSVPSCWICAVVSPMMNDEEFVAGRVAPVSSTVSVPVVSVMDMFCREMVETLMCSSNAKERVAAAMSRFGVRSVRVGGVLSSVMVSAPFVRGANTFPTRS